MKQTHKDEWRKDKRFLMFELWEPDGNYPLLVTSSRHDTYKAAQPGDTVVRAYYVRVNDA